MSARQLPESVYNWTTVAGAVLAVASLSIIILLLLIDAFVQATTVYLGLLTFVNLCQSANKTMGPLGSLQFLGVNLEPGFNRIGDEQIELGHTVELRVLPQHATGNR